MNGNVDAGEKDVHFFIALKMIPKCNHSMYFLSGVTPRKQVPRDGKLSSSPMRTVYATGFPYKREEENVKVCGIPT